MKRTFTLCLVAPANRASACTAPLVPAPPAWLLIHSANPLRLWIIFHDYRTFPVPFPVGTPSTGCACGLNKSGLPGGSVVNMLEFVDPASGNRLPFFSFSPNSNTGDGFFGPGNGFGFLSGRNDPAGCQERP